MWIALIASLLILSLLTIIQTPKEWLKKPITRIIAIIYNVIGLASVLLLLFHVWQMEDGFIREAIVWIETFYLTSAAFGVLASVIRYLSFEFARHFKQRKILKILNSHSAFYLATLIISLIYMAPAIYNATNIKTVSYDININKTSTLDSFSIALVADFHVGGGARHKEIDKMVAITNENNVDVMLITGDVCDSSSSINDLKYLQNALSKVNTKYGIIYVEGNHERECRIDVTPFLLNANVKILKNDAISINDSINIVGRNNELDTSIKQILDANNLNYQAPTIVMQHQPKDFKNMKEMADLVVCGHTHGYQYPFMGLLMPYTLLASYGKHTYDNMNVIVTSGVSEWGYRNKWPSSSEVCLINLTFKEDL